MRTIKSDCHFFNEQQKILFNIFYDYTNFTKRKQTQLESLGYKVQKSGKHYKCYYGNKFVTSISSTPSDKNAGHEILKKIKKFWEKLSYHKNNNI